MASLTVKGVKSLLSNGKPGKHRDGGSTGVRGLHLVVTNKRNASWQLRFQLHGKVRWMGLGSARDIDLDKAREKAKAAREQLVDKIDPLEARRSKRAAEKAAKAALAEATSKAKTFRWCAEQYIAANSGMWRNTKHGKQWASTLSRFAYPLIGDMLVGGELSGLGAGFFVPMFASAAIYGCGKGRPVYLG
ncbi:MAG: Arm DNA-binding domain-containing protein [Xanthobacteraceae bacterium]|nr:Arm DNA-binding domain-containing protein [Xanthobacteraceae bacterium]